MAKECDICGRPIKTGRKYCWEHRHTSQSKEVQEEKLIREAEEKLIKKVNSKTVFKFMKERRLPEYTNFVREYVKKAKEEREFRKSLAK